jgi:hypothetical protein
MPQGRRGRGFNSASYFAFAFSPNSTRGIRDRIASYLTFFLVLAFLAVTGVPAAQIPLAKAWAEREWRRERARLVRLWRSTGYTRAQFRQSSALIKALQAVGAFNKAKPRTIEGSVALLKFVADRVREDGITWMSDTKAEVSAPLYSALERLNTIATKRAG